MIEREQLILKLARAHALAETISRLGIYDDGDDVVDGYAARHLMRHLADAIREIVEEAATFVEEAVS